MTMPKLSLSRSKWTDDTKQLWVNTGPDVGQPSGTSKQKKNRRDFSDRIHEILFEYGYGEVTDWVIRRCSFFQRAAWALILAESCEEYEEDDFFTEEELDWLFGNKFAANLRKGKSILLKRIVEHFPEEYAEDFEAVAD
jgi:hypothetical protein